MKDLLTLKIGVMMLKNSALPSGINYIEQQFTSIAIIYLQYYCFYCIFGQIKAAL